MRGLRTIASFNPLHCGAVVASEAPSEDLLSEALVSIPFIAGQWSLQGGDHRHGSPETVGFNPLHCGAVVASSLPGEDIRD